MSQRPSQESHPKSSRYNHNHKPRDLEQVLVELLRLRKPCVNRQVLDGLINSHESNPQRRRDYQSYLVGIAGIIQDSQSKEWWIDHARVDEVVEALRSGARIEEISPTPNRLIELKALATDSGKVVPLRTAAEVRMNHPSPNFLPLAFLTPDEVCVWQLLTTHLTKPEGDRVEVMDEMLLELCVAETGLEKGLLMTILNRFLASPLFTKMNTINPAGSVFMWRVRVDQVRIVPITTRPVQSISQEWLGIVQTLQQPEARPELTECLTQSRGIRETRRRLAAAFPNVDMKELGTLCIGAAGVQELAHSWNILYRDEQEVWSLSVPGFESVDFQVQTPFARLQKPANETSPSHVLCFEDLQPETDLTKLSEQELFALREQGFVHLEPVTVRLRQLKAEIERRLQVMLVEAKQQLVAAEELTRNAREAVERITDKLKLL